MTIPKINLWVIFALVAIVGVIYLAYNSVQQQRYSGESLNFTTSGIITVDNPSGDVLMIVASSPRTFALRTNDPEQQSLRSTREGSGVNARYIVQAEIASSSLELNVTRGTDVEFVITNSEASALNAVVAARPANENRDIVLFAVAICLGLLVFISFQTEHYLLKQVMSRLPMGQRRNMETAPA